MEKHLFLTNEFYDDPKLLLSILNTVISSDMVCDMEMYQSGTFLFLEVYDNEKTRDLLKKVISNFDEYIVFYIENFVSDEDTPIGLCALHDIHSKYFPRNFEIRYNTKNSIFEMPFEKNLV